MIQRLILTVSLFITLFAAHGQATFGPRYEILQGNDNDAYMVIPNGEEGVLIAWTDYDPQVAVAVLSFEFLDNELNQKWRKNIEMPNRYLLKGHRYVDGKNYLLLESNMLDELKIYRIDPETGKVEKFLSTEIDEFQINKFEVLQNTAIIAGYIGNRPVVFSYDFNENKLRTLSKVYQNNSLLVEVKVNNDQETFNVLTTVYDQNKEQTLQVNTFKYHGELIRSYYIRAAADYHIVNGVSSSFDDSGQVVVGLYGYKDTFPVSGLYVNHIDWEGNHTLNYYNFTELPQFLNYMGEKGKRKQVAKAQKLKAGGKELTFKLSALPQKLIETGNQMVFTGEFFRSQAEAGARNSVLYGGLPNANLNDMYGHYGYMTLPGDIPLPQIMHQAYAVVINKDGSLAWDSHHKLDIRNRNQTVGRNGSGYMNLELGTGRNLGFLRAIGNFNWANDQGSYAWYRDGELNVKALGQGIEGDVETQPLKLKADREKIVHEKNATFGTLNWYDNHILIYGIQHIRPADRTQQARRVFFVNKVALNQPDAGSQMD